jgi:hypothetical protein
MENEKNSEKGDDKEEDNQSELTEASVMLPVMLGNIAHKVNRPLPTVLTPQQKWTRTLCCVDKMYHDLEYQLGLDLSANETGNYNPWGPHWTLAEQANRAEELVVLDLWRKALTLILPTGATGSTNG